MADFCKQCGEDIGFEADFTNLFTQNNETPKSGMGFWQLCETCGPQCFVIDDAGTCGSPHCNGHERTKKPHGVLVDGD